MTRCALLATLVLLQLSCHPRRSGRAEPPLANAAAEVSVDERLGAELPRHLAFTEADGRSGPLSSHLAPGQPALVVFAYARCRTLCSVVLRSMTKLVRGTRTLRPGRDYQILLIALDPEHSLEEARRQRTTLTVALTRSEQTGVSYLVGRASSVADLADAVGYHYRYDAATEQYAHPAVMIVVDRRGRVARYIHALGTEAPEFERALLAAREDATSFAAAGGLSGELLRCFRFDPALRRHRDAIQLYFRAGGAVILALVCALLFALMRWERGRRR